jgi:glycosyltransferase involved in cell wall biosynthesis
VRVIPNGVDFEEFDRGLSCGEARAALGLEPGRPVVTMLGGVLRAKGTLTLVHALPLVRRVRPDVVFVVAGSPPIVGHASRAYALAKYVLGVDAYDRRVQADAAEATASSHLRFVGIRQDVPRLLAATDVLAFPATAPHFARPIIEAGAMARPVVASRLGPALELVREGVTGLLVPPSDPPALAEALLALLGDPERARAMGEEGYRHVRAGFDADTTARRTFDVYREILG